MSVENPFPEKPIHPLRKRFEEQQAEARGKAPDKLDETIEAFFNAEEFKLLGKPEPEAPPPEEIAPDTTWLRPNTPDEWYGTQEWPLRHAVMATLAGVAIVVTGAGFAGVYTANYQRAFDERAREFGLTGELLQLEALEQEGVCQDELLASQQFHEELARHAMPESIERQNHRNAAGRFGAAALLAQEHAISCYPRDAATWDISETLTPKFDVYTLDLGGQCAQAIEEKMNTSNPDDVATGIKLGLQRRLSKQHDLDCK